MDTSRLRTCGFCLCLLVACSVYPLAGSPPHPRELAVFPAGTTIPIRFLNALSGGRERPGTPVLVQTLGALVKDGCVIVEPFTQVQATIVVSRGGGRFGRPGRLVLSFDSIEVAPRQWARLSATLDSLEYISSSAIKASGAVFGKGRGMRARVVRTGALMGVGAVTEIGVIPAALLAGWGLTRSGPRPRILAGEVASLRLVEPLQVMHSDACVTAGSHPDLAEPPSLPHFVPRTADDARGRRPGDPINLVLLGSEAEIDSAFLRTGWVRAQDPGFRALARGVTAAVVQRSAVGAPVSTQYFEGRKQDLAYELSGPNARLRHHLRIWLLDEPTQTWVAAADQDVGLVIHPLKGSATHRIAPDLDPERDLIVRVLEASGCADLVTYLELPGALTDGRNASGQRFTTDGRAAVVRARSCK